MQLSAEPIIYGLIFVGVVVLVEGLYLVAFGKSISLNNRVNRRLEMLDKGTGREQVLEQLRKEMQQHMKSRSIPLYSLLADRAQKAAIAFTPRQLIMIMGGLAVATLLTLIFLPTLYVTWFRISPPDATQSEESASKVAAPA